MKKTFKTIKQVQFFKDKSCTIPYTDARHDLRVFPRYKGQVVNYYGGVFGMPYTSGKNNINKVVSCVTMDGDPANEYYYSIVVQGRKAYFKLNINLYCFDEVTDGAEYETLIPIERKRDVFKTMKEVHELDAMDNRSPLDSGINPSY